MATWGAMTSEQRLKCHGGAHFQADGLWASLVEVHTEEGHASDAVTGPERLERSSDTGWAPERNG